MLRSVFAIAFLIATLPWSVAQDGAAKARAKDQRHIDKGLEWLAKQQATDGHWEAQEGTYPIAMTALAGIALLAEGSTPDQGKYARHIDQATQFLLNRVQRDGLIGNRRDSRESGQYMFGHSFAMLFLSQVYAKEKNDKFQKELRGVLTRAVEFTGKAQTKLGGWGYVSAAEGNDFDEGAATVTQIHALNAVRAAGIDVPKTIIDQARAYLGKSCSVNLYEAVERGKAEAGVIYSLSGASKEPRPALTVAALAAFPPKDRRDELALKWLNFVQKNIAIDQLGRRRQGYDEYVLFYLSQVVYAFGEEEHARLRPDLAANDKNLLKWSRYRDTVFPAVCAQQNDDGSWNGLPGPVYASAMHLVVLQLDKEELPFCRRPKNK